MVRIRRTGTDTVQMDMLSARAKARRRWANSFVAFPDNFAYSDQIRRSLRDKVYSAGRGGTISVRNGIIEVTAHMRQEEPEVVRPAEESPTLMDTEVKPWIPPIPTGIPPLPVILKKSLTDYLSLDTDETIQVNPVVPLVAVDDYLSLSDWANAVKIGVQDYLSLGEEVRVPSPHFGIGATDNLSLSEDVTVSAGTVAVDESAYLNLDDNVTATSVALISVTESLSIADTIEVRCAHNVTVNDYLSLDDTLTVISVLQIPVEDALNLSSNATVVRLEVPPLVAPSTDSLSIGTSSTVTGVLVVDTSDSLSLDDNSPAIGGIAIDLSDSLSLNTSITVARGVAVALETGEISDYLSVTDSVNAFSAPPTPIGHDWLQLGEEVSAFFPYFSADVTDNLALSADDPHQSVYSVPPVLFVDKSDLISVAEPFPNPIVYVVPTYFEVSETDWLAISAANIWQNVESTPPAPPAALEVEEDDRLELAADDGLQNVESTPPPPPGTIDVPERGEELSLTTLSTLEVTIPTEWLWTFDSDEEGWDFALQDGSGTHSSGRLEIRNFGKTAASYSVAYKIVDVKENTTYDIEWDARVTGSTPPAIYKVWYVGDEQTEGGILSNVLFSVFHQYTTGWVTYGTGTFSTTPYTTGSGETELTIAVGGYVADPDYDEDIQLDNIRLFEV